MPVILAVLRVLALLWPLLVKLVGYLGFIWKFVKVVAASPVAWIAMAFGPTLAAVIEAFTGVNLGISGLYTSIISSMLQSVVSVVFDYDIASAWGSLPANVVELSCYLGLNQAIQVLLNGLVSCLVVLLTLRINLMIVNLRMSFLKRR